MVGVPDRLDRRELSVLKISLAKIVFRLKQKHEELSSMSLSFLKGWGGGVGWGAQDEDFSSLLQLY